MRVITQKLTAFIHARRAAATSCLKSPGVPGEPASHTVDLGLPLELFEEFPFPVFQLPLMNCTMATLYPWPSARRAVAEGGGGLALPVAGVDDDQSLFNGTFNAFKFPRGLYRDFLSSGNTP